MSKKEYPLKYAMEEAEYIVRQFEPVTERIDIAGSIRRRKPFVSDIEIIAEIIPASKKAVAFWGKVIDMLGYWYPHVDKPNGDRFFQRVVYTKIGPITVDFFVVMPPAQWGWIYALRTGPDTFNTRKLLPAIKRLGYRAHEGRIQKPSESKGGIFGDVELWDDVATPTELDLFELLGMPFITPEKRS